MKSQCGSSLVVNCAIGDHNTGTRIVASVVEERARETTNKLICITVDGYYVLIDLIKSALF